ncbi:MAG TPA: DUF6279 family lipoprotein [Lamprocystis sp. (in: g-proteobacteria)]|nr:DUF6279 family lipoprotein [Lamprocystis sp. (in: g-proteobacteria)]
MQGQSPWASILALVGTLLVAVLPGCSQIQIAYGTSEFLIKRYADDYLKLDSVQMARWEPALKTALDAHRALELPLLAGFFDALLKASEAGFDQTNTRCLTASFRTLYLRHARLAVGLAAPLLAGLTPAQVELLDQRFTADYEEDRMAPGTRDLARERRKRARRYVKSIEDWTGTLNDPQRALVAEVTARMPDTTEAVLAYRTEQRRALITLLRAGADEVKIERFLTDWLVDYRGLPPSLSQAGDEISDRIGELLIQLGAGLDPAQRRRFNERLTVVRDDLMKLQKAPKLAPVNCPV